MRASFKASILFLLLHTIFIIIISNIIYLSREISDFQWAVTQHKYRKEGVAVVVIVVNCDHVERSSIECRKTKTEVITTANQKKENYLKGPMRTQSKNQPNTREHANYQVIIGFSFASDWSRELREFSGPITQSSKAETNQSWIFIDPLLNWKLF